ncbi:primosomal protein N' [Gammaproteobacteria bacterium]|nr:primosomal protein N' [Gammaproteobacteria bacterium]
MKKTIEVALNLPLYQTFNYLIPEDVSNIKAGTRVEVPFGRKKLIGICLGIKKQDSNESFKYKLKHFNKIIDEKPLITNEILRLGKWASKYYQHPIGQVLFSCIPSKIKLGDKIKPYDDREYKYIATDKEIGNYFKNKHAQKRLYEEIKLENGIKPSKIKKTLLIKYLIENGFIDKAYITQSNTIIKDIKLNNEQESAYKKIIKNISLFTPTLIEGVTGSGKTELYIRVAKEILDSKGQVLIIVPEINLTPQTVSRFKDYLDCNISTYHSALTETMRLKTWDNCRNSNIDVLIGTRSAVFLPFANLKLIVIDEEHDASLKQSEKFRYHARDIALVRAKNANIPILMGSATPSFESFHNSQIKKYNHIVLKNRFRNTKLPSVTVVDIKKDTTKDGFSSTLIRAIKKELNNGKQILLFVGRRGFSHTLLCNICGWTSKCSKCDTHMTFHEYEKKLWCHHCGAQEKVDLKNVCKCKIESEIVPLGVGTERVEKKANELFPKSKIMRIDSDTINNISKLNSFLEKAKNGDIDILIGTQMLVKGHDFPNLTLVGIIDIDSGLYSLDFRGIEKIAQMIIQVAGRSGRHSTQGKVIIQTRKPNHPIMTKLLENGYNDFANTALKERDESSLPPHSYLSLFRVSSINKGEGLLFLNKIKNYFNNANVNILGPAPAPILKKNNRYYYQLLINSHNRNFLLQKSSEIREYILEQKKSNLRWSIDIDPIDLY